MSRAFLLVVIGILALAPAAEAAGAAKHSGVVQSVSSGTLTIAEVGIGMGHRNQLLTLSIGVTPQTRIVLASRSDEVVAAEWPGGFREAPVALTDVRPGDYATVEVDRQNGRLVARSIVVVRPTGDTRQ
jgi:hypothetical protein